MFFRKQESKKRHPVLGAMVAGLSVIGACSLVSAGKSFVLDKMGKIASMIRRDKKAVEKCMDEVSK